jgi:hypothetical protein
MSLMELHVPFPLTRGEPGAWIYECAGNPTMKS